MIDAIYEDEEEEKSFEDEDDEDEDDVDPLEKLDLHQDINLLFAQSIAQFKRRSKSLLLQSEWGENFGLEVTDEAIGDIEA